MSLRTCRSGSDSRTVHEGPRSRRSPAPRPSRWRPDPRDRAVADPFRRIRPARGDRGRGRRDGDPAILAALRGYLARQSCRDARLQRPEPAEIGMFRRRATTRSSGGRLRVAVRRRHEPMRRATTPRRDNVGSARGSVSAQNPPSSVDADVVWRGLAPEGRGDTGVPRGLGHAVEPVQREPIEIVR